MRELTWESEWGTTYDPSWKKEDLEPVLRDLDRDGKIGRLVVDVGAGAHPVSASLQRSGRKIVEIDIAAREQGHGRFQLAYDIGKIDDGSMATSRALWRAAKYAEEDLRQASRERVDTIICSEILNYVDAVYVLSRLASYLKPGGRFVIFNMANRGFTDLFSERKFATDEQLRAFLEAGGFEIELSKRNTWTKKEEFLFVARKRTADTAV